MAATTSPRSGAAAARATAPARAPRPTRARQRELTVVEPTRRRLRLGVLGCTVLMGIALTIVALNIVMIIGQRELDSLAEERTAAEVQRRELQARLASVLSPSEVEERIEADGRFIRAEDVVVVPAGGPVTAPAPIEIEPDPRG